jgi:hypothetical protein
MIRKTLLVITAVLIVGLLIGSSEFNMWGQNSETSDYTIKAIVDEAPKIDMSFSNKIAKVSTTYKVMCPGGTYGCGDSFGPPCEGNPCAPSPPKYRRTRSCPDDPGFQVCELSSWTLYPACDAPAACPSDPTAPTKTPIPCSYGTIPFGCFNGWTSGPSCSVLVNCQTPPL